jgi:hypothetical protein
MTSKHEKEGLKIKKEGLMQGQGRAQRVLFNAGRAYKGYQAGEKARIMLVCMSTCRCPCRCIHPRSVCMKSIGDVTSDTSNVCMKYMYQMHLNLNTMHIHPRILSSGYWHHRYSSGYWHHRYRTPVNLGAQII